MGQQSDKSEATELEAKLQAASKPDRELDAAFCSLFGYEIREHDNRYYYQPIPDYSWQPVPDYSGSVDEILKLFEEKSVFNKGFSLHELFHDALKAMNFKYHWATRFSLEDERGMLPINLMLSFLSHPKQYSPKEHLAEVEKLWKSTAKELGLSETDGFPNEG